jgi:hypothetical protein
MSGCLCRPVLVAKSPRFWITAGVINCMVILPMRILACEQINLGNYVEWEIECIIFRSVWLFWWAWIVAMVEETTLEYESELRYDALPVAIFVVLSLARHRVCLFKSRDLCVPFMLSDWYHLLFGFCIIAHDAIMVCSFISYE